MSGADNPRGEAELLLNGRAYRLRPTFDALIRAEEELGSLIALVDRAAEGQLRLAEMAALFWHCLEDREALTREELGEALVELGIVRATPPLRVLLAQVLKGAG
jgi:hypothetical protein